jgi:hypothetical protein
LFSLLSLQSASRTIAGFPNVLVSVAEMQIPSMLGAGMISMFLANTNGVINGLGGILVFFAGLTVLATLVLKVLKLRNDNTPVSSSTNKPHKSQRVSSAKKLDNELKAGISIGNFNWIHSMICYPTNA